MSLIDLVQQQLGPSEMSQISRQLGVDDATAQRAVQSALPTMVAGMAGQSQQPEGATSIQSLLGGNAGGMNGLAGAVASAIGGGGAGGILGSILGRHENDVHEEVQQRSGLDSAKTRQLLMILAPIVLSALAHRRSQAPAAPSGQPPKIDDVLKHEAQQAHKQSPGVGGLLGKILSHVETPRS